jgi:hypothetical protein
MAFFSFSLCACSYLLFLRTSFRLLFSPIPFAFYARIRKYTAKF